MFDVLFAKEKKEIMEQQAIFNGRISASLGFSRDELVNNVEGEIEPFKSLAIQAYDETAEQQARA